MCRNGQLTPVKSEGNLNLKAVAMLVAISLSTGATFACDICYMPLGYTIAKGNWEAIYMYLDRDQPTRRAPEHVQLVKLFIGVSDAIEVDVRHVRPQGKDDNTEVTINWAVVPLRRNHPSLIVGVTNIFGAQYLGAKEPSEFMVSAYNFLVPQGPPTPRAPLVRGHLGYGNDFHDGWFGALQYVPHPSLRFALVNYQDDWLVDWRVVHRLRPDLEVHWGQVDTDPRICVRYCGDFR